MHAWKGKERNYQPFVMLFITLASRIELICAKLTNSLMQLPRSPVKSSVKVSQYKTN